MDHSSQKNCPQYYFSESRVSSWSRFFFVPCCMAAVIALNFLGCTHAPTVNPLITSTVASHGVQEGTYNKMKAGRPLHYNDILNLVEQKVPSHMIVGYLRSTQHIYHFKPKQLETLRQAGASTELINYLEETEGFYDDLDAHKKAHQPYFENSQIMYDWVDSPYEESCYSPFSLN